MREGEYKIPLCNHTGGSFSSDLLRAILSYWAEYQEFCQASAVELFCSLKTLTISARKHHHRCLTGFQLALQLEKYCKYGMQVDSKSMEFVIAAWCRGKQLGLDRTIRDHPCGDLEILHVVIRLGVTRLKKTAFVCLLTLLGKRCKVLDLQLFLLNRQCKNTFESSNRQHVWRN